MSTETWYASTARTNGPQLLGVRSLRRASLSREQGNSKDGTGYGCSLPAMINLWRSIWTGAAHDALFGVATLAAGGSEGPGWHMSGDPHRFL